MTLAPGSTLGPYTVTAELGHGGMGVVYTAHDPRLDRQVAIKVLPPDLTRDETAKRRFLQEARRPWTVPLDGGCRLCGSDAQIEPPGGSHTFYQLAWLVVVRSRESNQCFD